MLQLQKLKRIKEVASGKKQVKNLNSLHATRRKNIMKDFVFGTLSTVEKRLAYFQSWYQGIRHHNQLSPRAPRAGDAPTLTVTVAIAETIEQIVCRVSEPETAVYPFKLVNTEWDLLNWEYRQTWEVTLPPQPEGTLVRYTIEATPTQGNEPYQADNGTVFSYLVGDPAAPEWSHGAIIYQIFPDRFWPGNGRSWNKVNSLSDIYGGTLQGIIDKLDYIADMGFNTIWLNPFFPDDNSHHGYHATDYYSVNPRMGTLDDIKELVEKAHARGIRLLLDFVANHWSTQHNSFQEAIKDPNSPYYDWYHWIDYPNDYETFFGVMALPQVNVNNPEVREYLLTSAAYWLGEIGFDGLRLDYALGPSHDFWTTLRQAAKKVRPDAWIFGEVTQTPNTILSYEGQLDGCLDFPLLQSMRDTFAIDRMSLTAFDTFLNHHERFFPKTFSLPSFLDNHDMNRFSWSAKNDKRKLKVAAMCQFTLSGPPIVFNGTEVGVQQQMGMSDPGSQGMEECRQPMLWGEEQDADLREFFRTLIQFRQNHPVLCHGKRRTLHINEETKTYVYLRFDGADWVISGYNISDVIQTIHIQNPLTAGTHSFKLPAWSGEIVSPSATIKSEV